jgi:hypothetical protein
VRVRAQWDIDVRSDLRWSLTSGSDTYARARAS